MNKLELELPAIAYSLYSWYDTPASNYILNVKLPMLNLWN
jgi:hypothetical protein